MANSRTWTAWGLGVFAILLSPVIVIFSIPLAIGMGLDIFDLLGAGSFALALSAPLAFVLLRLFSPPASARHPGQRLRLRLPSSVGQNGIARPVS